MPAETELRDVTLRTHIRRLIDEGRLPILLPDKISAGYGSWSKCDGCDQPVTPIQIEYDVEDSKESRVQLNLHLGCFVLWQVECVKRIRKHNGGALPD